jgi:N-methylhydantoinase A
MIAHLAGGDGKETGLRLAVDTGGTFTDLVVEQSGAELRFYKRPTTPADPIDGLLGVLQAAAADHGQSVPDFLGRAELLVFGTTRATNAVVTGTTALTALLCTRGHPDILLFREGGGRTTLFDYSQEYPAPYVPRSLTFEVPERLYADGTVAHPLEENAVRVIARELVEREVMAVAVCLLWSIVNPVHERRVGALLAEEAPDIAVTLSHRLNPSLREYRRASSAAIDASLKPLMTRFFRELGRRLAQEGFGGRLLIMTSSGGVLDADAVAEQPIHSIGSGPAAAPVAGRHYGRIDTGSETALVTDAGGTTYDVSLVRRGRIPWTRETIVGHPTYGYITGFPSVDVTSVGAGGGSIAWVDEGGLLHVGPQSAAADPGPACYGRGGDRPTVTDACLLLGYIDPDYFLGGEMAVSVDLAREALERDVARPLGLDVQEAASAVLRLAIERMVTAIEGITLKQGIDPALAVMIGGGGGAGLYSVGIARRLGISRVVVPDVAAALSATGALLSELQTSFAVTEVMSTADFDPVRAATILNDLRARSDAFLAAAGSGAVETAIGFSVEARYPHQVWEIEVPLRRDHLETAAEVEELREDFHATHDELFAMRDEQAPVELVTWRAHVRGALRHGEIAGAHTEPSRRTLASQRDAYFPGLGIVTAPVRRIDSVAVGERLAGPLILESPVTTVVLDERASLERLASGSLLIDPLSGSASNSSAVIPTGRAGEQGKTSPLQLALLSNRFDSVARAMMNTLLRTARSAILNTARDFSCCVLTAGDELLAMAESLPIHVMSGPDLIARYMKETHPRLRRGDAFLHNSPYHGNSHAADWCVVVPVVDDEGVHRFTVLAKAHLADCGNAVPTTYVADAKDVYNEGALIFPCVKVQDDYRNREDVLRMARARIRVPDLWYGDFLALLGAARIGERRLLDLVGETGGETLGRYERDWFDYSEQRMIAAIQKMPAGTVVREGRHDPIPGMPDGVPVKAIVKVDPRQALIDVDLRDNLDCQPCGLNLTEATARTAAMMGVFTGLGTVVPPNAGSFRRLRIHVRENCIVGIPRHPHSCSAATTDLSELTASLVALALGDLGEGFGLAQIGRAQPASMAVISGVDAREGGGPFVNQLILAVTGGAGAPRADGWLTILGIGAAGFLFRDSVEIDEMKYPLVVHEQRILPDTEGAGRFRGSPGAYVEFGPIDGCDLDVVYLSDGTYNPSVGVRGGLPGGKAMQRRRSVSGELSDELGAYATIRLLPGETIVGHTCGGGGYGPPHEREPSRVAWDVREGWITHERAFDVYGVRIDDDGGVDAPATAARRAAVAHRAERPG